MNTKQVIVEAIEKTHGNLVPSLVGPQNDTLMVTFDSRTDARDFTELVRARTELNAWTRESTSGPGHVAFVNNRKVDDILNQLPW